VREAQRHIHEGRRWVDAGVMANGVAAERGAHDCLSQVPGGRGRAPRFSTTRQWQQVLLAHAELPSCL
jgi:hypothetical protein